MKEIERAIKHFESLQKRYTTTHNGKHCELVKTALTALREQAEREKGCEWCADNYDHRHKTMFRKGSDWNYEAKYCDMCGKRLEVKQYHPQSAKPQEAERRG